MLAACVVSLSILQVAASTAAALSSDVVNALCAENDSGPLSFLQSSAARSSSTSVAQCNNTAPVQVFLDVDDTYQSSGGHRPSGCDGLYEKGVIYPGMTQFVLELARGPDEATSVLQPAVMSARPNGVDFLKVKENSPMVAAMMGEPSDGDHADRSRQNADATLQIPIGLKSYRYKDGGILDILKGGEPGREFGLDIAGSMYGELSDGLDFQKMGETKYKHFRNFFESSQGANDACVVWIGDDGQGDCNPATYEMRKLLKTGQQQLGLKAAFIHRLTCANKRNCSAFNDIPDEAPILTFDTYLDAARQAMDRNFISHAGFERVKDAVESFHSTYCDAMGATKAPETVSQLGCLQLKTSMERNGPSEKAKVTSMAGRRFQAFCSQCCAGAHATSAHEFDFNGDRWRCHNMYHKHSSWRWPMAASDGTCLTHCEPTAE